MKYTLKAPAVFIALCIACLASCTKSGAPPNNIVGKWKLTKLVLDLNKDAVIDAGDSTMSGDTAWNNNFLIFSANGSLSSNNHGSATVLGNWTQNNNKYKIQFNGTTYSPDTMQLDSVTSTTLIIKETCQYCFPGNASTQWDIFTKQ